MSRPCPMCEGAAERRGRCLHCRYTGSVADVPGPPPTEVVEPEPPKKRKKKRRPKLTRHPGGGVTLTARVLGIDVQAEVGDLLGELGELLDD